MCVALCTALVLVHKLLHPVLHAIIYHRSKSSTNSTVIEVARGYFMSEIIRIGSASS